MIYGDFNFAAMSLFDEWWLEEGYTSLKSPKEASHAAWLEQFEIIREIGDKYPQIEFEKWWPKVSSSLSAKDAASKAWDFLEEIISDLETEHHLKGTAWNM
jgi:hypothetical protein